MDRARTPLIAWAACALATIGLTACTASSTAAHDGRSTGRTSASRPAPDTGSSTSGPAVPRNIVLPNQTPHHRFHDPENFGPDAVSFVSRDEGWALEEGACSGCALLFHTADAGRTWSVRAHPRLPAGPRGALVTGSVDMYFADRRHGYIYTADGCGTRCMSVTSDGGRTWRVVRMPRVAQLVGTDGRVYVLGQAGRDGPTGLRVSRPGSPHWVREALPRPARSGRVLSVAADGDTVALLRASGVDTAPRPGQLGALWVSTDAGASWSDRAVPCRTDDGAAALVSVALAHPNALLIDCYDSLQSQQAMQTQHHLYGSGDDGRTWVRLADPVHTGVPALLADNGAGHAFLATDSGGLGVLAATTDGAADWHRAISDPHNSFFGWSDLRFLSARTGFVLGPTHYAREKVYRTLDAGRTWHTIPLPRPTH